MSTKSFANDRIVYITPQIDNRDNLSKKVGLLCG